jgi:TP901 family phage tail tape measure protein
MARGNRKAKAELTLQDKMGRGLRVARKRVGAFAKSSRSMVGSAMRGIGFGAIAAGGGIVAALASGGREVLRFEERMTRLQIQSGRTVHQMGDFRSQIDKVSRETGVARGEILDAASGFVSLTGDMDGAQDSLKTFARVAVASGASMTDIANTAAALRQNLNVRPDEMEKAFSIILAGGKAGAIELKELSGLLSSITPMFSQFGTTGAEGMAELGAMLQLSRQGFGSATEAVTGMQGMMVAFTKNAKKFKGVKIFQKDPKTGEKTMRNLRDIVVDLGNSKLARDPGKLLKAFGRVEGFRAFQQLVKNKGALDALIESTRNADDVGKDFDTFQESAAGKLKLALNTFKQAIAEAFTPAKIEAFVKAVEKTFEWLVKLVETMQDIESRFRGGGGHGTVDPVDPITKGLPPSAVMQKGALPELRGPAGLTQSVRTLSGVGATVAAEQRSAIPPSIAIPAGPFGFVDAPIPGRLRTRGKSLNLPETDPLGTERLGDGRRSAPREERIKITVEPSRDFDVRVERRRKHERARQVQ